jgi:hypothetical protein
MFLADHQIRVELNFKKCAASLSTIGWPLSIDHQSPNPYIVYIDQIQHSIYLCLRPTASYWARSSRTSPSLSGECQLHVVCFDSNLLYRRKISQIEIFSISLFYVVQSWWGPYYCLFDLVLYRSLDICSLLFYFILFFRPQHSSIIKFQSFV